VKKRGPFIGITCDVEVPGNRRQKERYELLCDHRYPEMVKEAGGYPIILPIARRSRVIRSYLSQVDGLIIVGGDDVDPALYGETRKKGTGTVFGPRLRFERKLYSEARRIKIPIYGICYGMQLINVLEGGSLYQDIRRDAQSKLTHNDKRDPLHRVRVKRDSLLRRLVKRETFYVHSDHHQAVRTLAPGFEAVAFASDGTIEAIEDVSEEILAVQWHPERRLNHLVTKRLCKAFTRMCLKPSRR